jgi:alkylated DNA repair dioxygenase AlkB
MTIQGELFRDSPPVPVSGMLLVEDAVSPELEGELIQRIDAAPLEPFQFGQWQGKRLTVHYGRAYDFTRGRLDPAPPLPDWLIALRERLAPLAGLDPDALAAALLIRYDPGAGIGWHRDRRQYGEVLGLSLGAAARMRLRRRTTSGFERRGVWLPARSLYRLSGEVRWEWEHSIAPMEVPRWSITFRTLGQGSG